MKLHILPQKQIKTRYYVPVVAILAAIATLILLLVVYTSRNLTLARHRLEDSLLQEGIMLTQAIEAGSRAGMRMRWRIHQLQTLVEEIGQTPKIVYILVIGADGSILAHTQKEHIENVSTFDKELSQETFATRTIQISNNSEVFEIISKVDPPSVGQGAQESPMGMRRRMIQEPMGEMMGEQHGLTDVAFIQIGMSLDELQELQQRDIRNAILLLIVLSVVGSAALYFIVFIQNYYAVDHAFQTMKSYTQHVVDSMVNGLISLDTQGKIVTMNQQAHHILDVPPEERIEGKSLSNVMNFNNVNLFNDLKQGEQILEEEFPCETASQKMLPLSLSASMLTDDDGNQLGTVLLFRDLSDVKALQEQVKRTERLASVGQLAAGVAHEIRNPLGALKGFLQYFQRKLDLQGQDKTYLTVMMSEVDRLNTVVSNLLEFARPREPERELNDVHELVEHVLTLIKGDFQAKEVQLHAGLKEQLPQIYLDRDQITQVLLNILMNALQSTDSGGGVSLAADVRHNMNQLELRVSDSGEGIAPEELSQIFDPFFTTKKRGSGLGLAIAHTIIENHHGEITVESEEGKGSTFRIFLPL